MLLIAACGYQGTANCRPLRCNVLTTPRNLCTCGESLCDACIIDGFEPHVVRLRCDTGAVVSVWCELQAPMQDAGVR